MLLEARGISVQPGHPLCIIQAALEGADTLFLILPDTKQDPVEDVFNTLNAAKEAGVKHLLLQVF